MPPLPCPDNPATVVHGAGDLRAVLAQARSLGRPAAVITAPGAAAYGGAGWFAALITLGRCEFPGVPFTATLDCGDDPGLVLAAWRQGIDRVRFNGPAVTAARLAALAAQTGRSLEIAG